MPVPTLMKSFYVFAVASLIFIVLGVTLLIYSLQVQEKTFGYSAKSGGTAYISFTLDEKMNGPVYIYYQLRNYYQNHRSYISAKSLDQLNGKDLSYGKIKSDCSGAAKNKDIFRTTSIDGTLLDPEAVAHPCGLVA